MDSNSSWIVIVILLFVFLIILLVIYYWKFIYSPDRKIKDAADNATLPSGFPSQTKS